VERAVADGRHVPVRDCTSPGADSVVAKQRFGILAGAQVVGLGAISRTTLAATWSWSKTPSIMPSKRSAQRCARVTASIKCIVMRMRDPALRTLPSSK
jgi:hypothetical protein